MLGAHKRPPGYVIPLLQCSPRMAEPTYQSIVDRFAAFGSRRMRATPHGNADAAGQSGRNRVASPKRVFAALRKSHEHHP